MIVAQHLLSRHWGPMGKSGWLQRRIYKYRAMQPFAIQMVIAGPWPYSFLFHFPLFCDTLIWL